MKGRWLLAGLLLFALGVGLAAALQAGLLPNPRLYLLADVGTLCLALGALLAAAVLAVGWLVTRERNAAERALTALRHEQDEDHRRFIRRLDHELKNPLTAIRAGMANLGQEAGSTEAGKQVAGVRAQVDRLARLSGDLRKLADLETQPVEQEPVHLGPLLAELCDTVQQRPDLAGCKLHLVVPTAPWPLPPVAGDGDLLFLALHNLVDNAVKFSRPGDVIEVRASEDGASAVVEVADTGPGIPADELPHVGEELYRGSAGRNVAGSGLGLALVRGIVARHGGSVAVRSRAGQGTVVTVRLPLTR